MLFYIDTAKIKFDTFNTLAQKECRCVTGECDEDNDLSIKCTEDGLLINYSAYSCDSSLYDVLIEAKFCPFCGVALSDLTSRQKAFTESTEAAINQKINEIERAAELETIRRQKVLNDAYDKMNRGELDMSTINEYEYNGIKLIASNRDHARYNLKLLHGIELSRTQSKKIKRTNIIKNYEHKQQNSEGC